MLNKIFLMGRLTRDPELRRTQSGTAVASFSLAVDRDFKDKQTGEKATDFIDIVAWRSTGEFVSKYFTKGRMAVVEGRLQIRDWTDKDGGGIKQPSGRGLGTSFLHLWYNTIHHLIFPQRKSKAYPCVKKPVQEQGKVFPS